MERDADGLAEAYKAPAEDYDSGHAALASDSVEQAFYVVSRAKLVTLYLSTFGVYNVYWFYKHWKYQQAMRFQRGISPVGRAIFSLFFVVQLFKAMDVEAREDGYSPAWNPTAYAAAFIVLTLLGRVVDKLGNSASGAFELVSLAIPLLTVVPIVSAQGVVNLTAGDENGRSNSKLSAKNVAWVVLGLAGWALVVASLLLPGVD